MTASGATKHRLGSGLSLRRAGLGRYAGVLAGLVAVCVYLSITQDVFLSWSNWQNIFRANSVVLLLALGMTFVVITAGIDLSVASMTVASGMVMGLALGEGWPWLVVALVSVGTGLGMGLVNGVLIGLGRVSFFVVTLGTLSIYASVALLTTFGETIQLYDRPAFSTSASLANESILGVPRVIVLCAVAYLIGAFVLRYTTFGRSVYAVGSNPEAARLAGVKNTAVLVSVYAISGLMAGIAALVQTGRLGAAAPQVDPTLMLTVVAAVLIGGTSYTGGEGGLLGTVIGVLFLGVVQNGLSLSSVSSFWQGTVSGLILILAVGFGVLRDRGWGFHGRRELPDDVDAPGDEVETMQGDERERIAVELDLARERVLQLETALRRLQEAVR